MRNKYGIGFLASVLILTMAVTCAYQISYRRTREKAEARIEAKKMQEAQEEAAVAADGQALKEDGYYLMEVNGYVVVYLSDRKTIYEYTDINCENLPELIREELTHGKYIESPEELYGFLENYSS